MDWELRTTRGIVARDSTCSVRRGMLKVLSGRLESGRRWGAVNVITDERLPLGSKVLLDVDGNQFSGEGRFELTPDLLAALRTHERAQIVFSSPRGDRKEAAIALDGFSQAFDQCMGFLEN